MGDVGGGGERRIEKGVDEGRARSERRGSLVKV